MNLKFIPNVLTFARLILVLPFLMFLYQREYRMALYIFFIAGITDGLDGWLARHFHWQTTLGRLIDPMADKLLVTASFISLALIGQLPWWLVILVFARDITISLGALAWNLLIQRKLDFVPTFLSKVNTAVQLTLVVCCLFQLAYFAFPSGFIQGLILLTTITTASSYIDYVWTWGKKAWTACNPTT